MTAKKIGKIERGARAALSGMTTGQRQEWVRQALKAGCSERQMAAALHMAPSSIHYIVEAVKGRPHTAARRDTCRSCGGQFKPVELDEGYCQDCIFGGAEQCGSLPPGEQLGG